MNKEECTTSRANCFNTNCKDHYRRPMCQGCYKPLSLKSTENAISRYGHGEICPKCGTKEALEGNFINK